MERICGIYKITNPEGQVYIGQSKDWLSRLTKYKRADCKKQPKLYNSIHIHGWASHLYEIIHFCNESQLTNLENYYIKIYNSAHNGLNCIQGNRREYSMSEATKEKLRKANLGKKLSEETKNKISKNRRGITRGKGYNISENHKKSISLGLRGNKNSFGRRLSAETIKKISASKKGIPRSEETKKKISESHVGLKPTEETLKKLSTIRKKMGCPWLRGRRLSEDEKRAIGIFHKGNKWFLGRRHSEESKRKMSESKKKKYVEKISS